MTIVDDAVVVLLRGINVGGHNRLPMADFRQAADRCGLIGAATHVQSGNLVARAPGRTSDQVASAVAAELQTGFELGVPVIVRSAEAWAAMLAGAPFTTEGDADGTTVHVGFLPAPASAALGNFSAADFEPERMAVVGNEIHLHLPAGMGRSKLASTLARTDNADSATLRNWKSVGAITRLLEQL